MVQDGPEAERPGAPEDLQRLTRNRMHEIVFVQGASHPAVKVLVLP